jgi:hypothetical protein
MSRDGGPFAACSRDRHTEDLPDLPSQNAPAGWWGVPAADPDDPTKGKDAGSGRGAQA